LEADRLNGRWIGTALAAVVLLGGLILAIFRPHYVSNWGYLAAVIGIELLVLCAWHYQEFFFPVLLVSFLWAGMGIPFAGVWQTARWIVLAAGAFLGFILWLQARRLYLHPFHYFFFAGVCAALASALSSPYPEIALLKVLSLFLLFVYSATGARLSIAARYKVFIPRFLFACEIVAWGSAAAVLLIGRRVFGNQNSMGAIMGVAIFPPLLWGALVATTAGLRRRCLMALAVCSVLLCMSMARAGMLAAAVAAFVVLVSLRRYKLLCGSVCALAVVLLGASLFVPEQVNDLTSSVLYKQSTEDKGVLESRRSVWRHTMNTIQQHPWLGTGFGTSAEGDAWNRIYVSTSSQLNREHGNSYLEMLDWLGVLGVLPFAAVLLLLVRQVGRVCIWIRRTGSALHPAVPLLAVVTAGLVHAIFEDWLLAVGYYLTVFFWPLAFSLMDLVPERMPVAPPLRVATVKPGVTPFPRPATEAPSRIG